MWYAGTYRLVVSEEAGWLLLLQGKEVCFRKNASLSHWGPGAWTLRLTELSGDAGIVGENRNPNSHPPPHFSPKVNKTYWLDKYIYIFLIWLWLFPLCVEGCFVSAVSSGVSSLWLWCQVTSGENSGIGENLLRAKIKEQNSVLISPHSLVSAQKPEMLTLSEIDFDFHSRAPGSGAECFQVLCSSAVCVSLPTPSPLGKPSHPALGE